MIYMGIVYGVAVLIDDVSVEEPSYLMLSQEWGGEEYLAPPAGKVEDFDASPEEAAVREVREETGIELEEHDLERLFETSAEFGADRLVWYETGIGIKEHDIELNHESSGYEILEPAEALGRQNVKLPDATLEALGKIDI